VVGPSDARRSRAGTHIRAGNAMTRTRAAILDGAGACVERHGVRRTTMAAIASSAGVAKATLYNHFRTKDDVFAALVEARALSLAEHCAGVAAAAGVDAALAWAADDLRGSAPLRRVAADEPAVLAALVVPGSGRAWDVVRAAVAQVLVAGGGVAGSPEVDLVLRWLLSQLLWPVPAEDAAPAAATLARALGAGRPGASALPIQGTPAEAPRPAGLGWPG
jgi:AcrR family transcriptional regulator